MAKKCSVQDGAEQVSNEKKPLTAEEIQNIFNQLHYENSKLKEQLAEAKNFIMFKRLDYLIEIVKHADAFQQKYEKGSFLHKALTELDETIYPQAQIEEETHNTNTID